MSRRADKDSAFLLPGETAVTFRQRQKAIRAMRNMTLDSLVQTHIRKHASRFLDIAPDTSGINTSTTEFLPGNSGQKNARTVKVLAFRIGPLVKGEKITCEYEDDGTANIYITYPAVNLSGDIPPGADGQRFNPGNATGDEDPIDNANSRMMSHTLEFSGGGRRDPLLVHMNAVNGRAGMPNLEHGYTIDDLTDPVPIQSQSGDENERSMMESEMQWRNGSKDQEAGSKGPSGPTVPKITIKSGPSGSGWVDKTRDSYKPGSTSAKLREINNANKARYGS